MQSRARVNDGYRRDSGHGIKEVRRVKSDGETRWFTLDVRTSMDRSACSWKLEKENDRDEEKEEERRFAPLSNSGRNEKWLALIFQAHREARSSPLRARNHPPHHRPPSLWGPQSKASAPTLYPLSLRHPATLPAFPYFLFPARPAADTHIPI